MCTPVGHALSGAALGLALGQGRPLLSPWKDLALFAFVSQAPDFDFLPGLFTGAWDQYHHGLSHSLGLALGAGLVMGLIGRHWGSGWRWAGLGFALYFLHLLLDWTTVAQRGIPLWWPLTDARYLADHPFFIDVWRRPWGLGLLWHNLQAVGLEAAVFAPLAAAALLWRRRMFAGRA